MRIIIGSIIVLSLALVSNSYAMQKVYYNPTSGKQIVDISGNKTMDKIKQEFGQADYQVIEIDENTEGVKVEDGKLKKYNYKEENEKIRQDKEKQIKLKEDKIKEKLGLSNSELQDLKEILR